MLRFIRDPIHQNILLKEEDLKVIDTMPFQRLRRVKQTGMVYLVYPGAQHTRFEHSIGVRHLAELILSTLKMYGLEINEDDELTLLSSALLHDIAHLPFSHSLNILDEEAHERLAEDIITRSEVRDVLTSLGISPKNVSFCIKGRGTFSSIIKSEIDADRLDYLQRDAYYCGVAYGVIDSRILMEFRPYSGKVLISEKGIRPAESVLFARYSMYNMVYGHKTVRIASSMLTKGVKDAIKRNTLSTKDVLKMGDEELLLSMKELEGMGRLMAERILSRRLYKRAHIAGWDDIDPQVIKDSLDDKKRLELSERLEEEIAQLSGLSAEEIIVDIPPPPMLEEANVKVIYRDQVLGLRNVSLLAEPISNSLRRSWAIGIYTDKKYVEQVGRVASKLLEG